MTVQKFTVLCFSILIFSSFYGQVIADNVFSHFVCNYGQYKEQCIRNLNETWNDLPKNESFCMGEFDRYICWPHTKVNSLAVVDCPVFVSSSKPETGRAYRFCHGDGSWFLKDSNKSWSFEVECNLFQQTQQLEEVTSQDETAVLEIVTLIYTIGSCLSLVFLVIALIILYFFEKLHCVRNYIHINLMFSFILLYVAILLKDKVVQDFYKPEKWLKEENTLEYNCEDFLNGDILIGCRIVIVFMHYALTCNYFWLFVEGVHLHLLLSYPMNNSKLGRYFSFYMAFGWGASLLPVLIWVMLKLSYANLGCWETSDEMKLWLVIRSPVIVTIVINFLIFINVLRIIFLKVQAKNIDKNDYKYTLAKSTLTLIPLLGIHYIVFLVLQEGVVDSQSTVMYIKIGFDLISTSVQGTFIALFYCFLNSEVRGEIRKFWKKWKIKNNMDMSTPQKTLTAHHSHVTNVTNVTSLLLTGHAEERV